MDKSAMINRIIAKIFSGRFLSFVLVIGTFCYITIIAINAVFGKIAVGDVDKGVVKEIAMYILGAFTTMAIGMYKEYFDRSDRGQITEVKQTEGGVK